MLLYALFQGRIFRKKEKKKRKKKEKRMSGGRGSSRDGERLGVSLGAISGGSLSVFLLYISEPPF